MMAIKSWMPKIFDMDVNLITQNKNKIDYKLDFKNI